MTMGLIYVIIFGILVVASIILAVIITRTLNSDKNIEILGKRLENSDTSINDAMHHLKITNEWSK